MNKVSSRAPRAPAVARLLRNAVAIGVVVGMAQAASARDNSGTQDFFSQAFSSYDGGGGGGEVQTQPRAPENFSEPSQPRSHRPLTVRLHRRPKTVVAQGPGKYEKVSIFEDRTLRRGDAVMTTSGIRIFAGSNSWPYRAEDFVGLADAGRMDSHVQKILADLNRLPRS